MNPQPLFAFEDVPSFLLELAVKVRNWKFLTIFFTAIGCCCLNLRLVNKMCLWYFSGNRLSYSSELLCHSRGDFTVFPLLKQGKAVSSCFSYSSTNLKYPHQWNRWQNLARQHFASFKISKKWKKSPLSPTLVEELYLSGSCCSLPAVD